mgnify:CR=1 FL=1
MSTNILILDDYQSIISTAGESLYDLCPIVIGSQLFVREPEFPIEELTDPPPRNRHERRVQAARKRKGK